MRILIVTARPQAFTTFAATLGEKGLETAFVPTAQAALEKIGRASCRERV